MIHPGEAVSLEAVKEEHEDALTVLCRRRDGVLIYATCKVSEVTLDDGRARGLLHCYADVTRTQVQFQASLLSARFRELLETTPDAVVIINASGHIVFSNTQAESMFGYERAEMLGQPIEVLMPLRYRGTHVHNRLHYFDAPRIRSMGAGLDLRARRQNGEEFPVEISLSPLRTEFGVMGMSAIRDVSDRRRIEQILKEKNVELERANLAKDRFLATMSHELRTPLNAILGFTSLLLMKLPGPLTQDQEKQLQSVQSSGRHLLSLINDLLDLAKIDSGNVSLSLEPVIWQNEVREVVDALRPVAQSKSLSMDLSLPEEELVSNMDRRLLRQVLMNLISNAVKYTPQGGVKVSLSRQGEVGGSTLHVCVEDTGVGVSAEDQARLFQPFSRVGDWAGEKPEGTGLGLHLSQRFMELLGGHIEVSSTPGVGSRFTLVFPHLGGADAHARTGD
ncbi:MAG: PAS domain-containing sensor histidine kinase [Aquabacterium sp.]